MKTIHCRFSFLPVLCTVVLSCTGCSDNPKKTSDGEEQKLFLNKFLQANAPMYESVRNDSMRCWHISSPDGTKDSSMMFSWVLFKTAIYRDSAQACGAFQKWKSKLFPPSEWNKAPQVRIRYGRYIYTVETGCFNDFDKVNSVYELFRSCLDETRLNKGDVVKIKCGGDVVN